MTVCQISLSVHLCKCKLVLSHLQTHLNRSNVTGQTRLDQISSVGLTLWLWRYYAVAKDNIQFSCIRVSLDRECMIVPIANRHTRATSCEIAVVTWNTIIVAAIIYYELWSFHRAMKHKWRVKGGFIQPHRSVAPLPRSHKSYWVVIRHVSIYN